MKKKQEACAPCRVLTARGKDGRIWTWHWPCGDAISCERGEHSPRRTFG